jgi:hypothetical protein
MPDDIKPGMTRLPDGTVVIACSRGATPRRTYCVECGKPSTLLCDYPAKSAGEARNIRTCDKPLCRKCAKMVGFQVDYCPDHDGAK